MDTKSLSFPFDLRESRWKAKDKKYEFFVCLKFFPETKPRRLALA